MTIQEILRAEEMMKVPGYVVFILSVIVVSTVTPLLFSKGKMKISWWDYAFPVLGPLLWLVLSWFHVGSDISDNNFLLEMFGVLMASITVPWARFAVLYMKSKMAPIISFILTLTPMATALLLRLTTSTLPD
jgi:apolipoprotein N-acyltransferase